MLGTGGEAGFGVDDAVEAEDAVEMVEFVLEELGEIPFGLDLVVVAMAIEVADANALVAIELNHEVGEAEAVVPHAEEFRAGPFDAGVDEFKALTVNFDVDDAQGDADLDGGDAAAKAVGALEFVEGIAEVLENGSSVGPVRNFVRDGAQEGVTQFYNPSDRHTGIIPMPSLPLTLCWFAVLSGYLPYSMGLAFLNPVLMTGYGFLGFLLGAHLGKGLVAGIVALVTTAAGLLVVNLSGGFPEAVLPRVTVLGANALLCGSSAMAATGLREWMERRGVESEAAAFRLRMGFAVAAVAFYFNGQLPYEWKVWLAEHTTSEDLVRFAVFVSVLFVGTWRMTR